MKFDPNIHHRQSIRLKHYDYSQTGAYFVTVCTKNRECLFGEIVDGEMRLNDFGEIVKEAWLGTAKVRSNIELSEFIVMPNHFHGILVISDRRGMAVTCPQSVFNLPPCHVTSPPREGTSPPCPYNQFGRPISGSLGTILGHFKSITTKRINRLRQTPGLPVWQRNYYEHVIRTDNDLNQIREYIFNNPLKWMEDEYHPYPGHKGGGLCAA